MKSFAFFLFCFELCFAQSVFGDVIPRTEQEKARIEAVTAFPTDFSKPEQFEALPGGATTNTSVFNRDIFSQPSKNMSFEQELDFKVGNGFFTKLWVSAPSSTTASDGLGPMFNARACQNCHLKDGRGKVPKEGEQADLSMFLRLSIPDEFSDLDEDERAKMANAPDPVYGHQLQDKANAGFEAEGRMGFGYTDLPVTITDDEAIVLRQPVYSIVDPKFGKPHDEIRLSPRIAPQMIGLGLVEAIPEDDILALADEEDRDGNGISGKANQVWSRAQEKFILGRFGWKAGMPSIREQSAGAFSGDMGLSTSLYPEGWGECTSAERACQEAPTGAGEDGLEVSDEVLDLVEFYAQNLAVPERQNFDAPDVLSGKAVFYDAGCADCHHPKFVTNRYDDERPQNFQLIWPYSDFLLHDMGEGLADGAREFDADGQEWRTAPLWGLGHTELVTGEVGLLHDGRARSILEAILWHGGEAQNARDAVVALPKDRRDELIKFLESL